jgi:hypothetical protein
MLFMRKIWLSGLVLAAMPYAAMAELLTEDQLDSVTAGHGRVRSVPVTTITGTLSSTSGLTADFVTSGYVSFGDTTLPATITGTLSSTSGLTANLATEAGVFRVTSADARTNGRARATPSEQSRQYRSAADCPRPQHGHPGYSMTSGQSSARIVHRR